MAVKQRFVILCERVSIIRRFLIGYPSSREGRNVFGCLVLTKKRYYEANEALFYVICHFGGI